MHVELTTGKDSFRAQGAYQKRNVSVHTFVRVNDDGEGRTIIPLFSAYQKKLKGFGKTSLVSTIPATSNFNVGNTVGAWYVNRHEVKPFTEILIEYRLRMSQGFEERVEHLMIVADPNAPLYQVRLDLPPHKLSSVPFVFFEGRFNIVDNDEQLPEEAIAEWKDYLGLSDEYEFSDILDPNQEEPFWKPFELEARVKPRQKTDVVKDKTGKRRVRFRRIRQIKL